MVYSRGPIILSLESASAVTSLLALGAIILALILFKTRTDNLIRAEKYSNYNVCTFVVGLVRSFHTPQGRANARIILRDNPQLNNCHSYAEHLIPFR